MKRLSDAQLTEIRERCEKATEGPWIQMNASNVFTELGARNNLGVRADENDGWMIADTGEGKTLMEGNLYEMHANENKANATFIANARQDIPALLAEVARLEEALREIDTHIRSTQVPIPYIIETLRENLPEYRVEEDA